MTPYQVCSQIVMHSFTSCVSGALSKCYIVLVMDLIAKGCSATKHIGAVYTVKKCLYLLLMYVAMLVLWNLLPKWGGARLAKCPAVESEVTVQARLDLYDFRCKSRPRSGGKESTATPTTTCVPKFTKVMLFHSSGIPNAVQADQVIKCHALLKWQFFDFPCHIKGFWNMMIFKASPGYANAPIYVNANYTARRPRPPFLYIHSLHRTQEMLLAFLV